MSYNPAANRTDAGATNRLISTYYYRTGLDRLTKKFRFMGVTEPDILPKRNGKQVQWFRYSNLAANTVSSSEGVVGTSLTASDATITATVSQYSDFMTFSTMIVDTALDPVVENHADLLGYRGGLTCDTLARIEFDSAVSSVGSDTIGAAAAVQDIRKAKALLEGVDVMPRDGDDFVAIFHPYVIFDIKSDNTAGGFIDIAKYAASERLLNGEAGRVDGCRIVSSTNVGDDGVAAPLKKYYGYVVGKGAVGHVSLEGNQPSNVVDPSKQNFALNMGKGGPQLADPEGNIGAWISYRFVQVFKILDSTNYRYRIIKADATVI